MVEIDNKKQEILLSKNTDQTNTLELNNLLSDELDINYSLYEIAIPTREIYEYQEFFQTTKSKQDEIIITNKIIDNFKNCYSCIANELEKIKIELLEIYGIEYFFNTVLTVLLTILCFKFLDSLDTFN